MLALTEVTKRYGERRVLDRLELHVEPGQSVAMLGANGSGKTTTLRCVVGLARVDAGRITIGGVDLAADPPAARARLSYLPQKAAFPQTLTVRETLAAVATLRRIDRRDVDRELELCGLVGLADRNVGALSGGERQRLAMAVAFLPSVDLYLFDEASASLDPSASRILFQRSRQLLRDGHALLFTTHVPADVRHLATRVVLLRDGRIESESAGEFELRRYERLLARDIWGDDHDQSDSRSDAGDHDVCGSRVHGARAFAGTGAA